MCYWLVEQCLWVFTLMFEQKMFLIGLCRLAIATNAITTGGISILILFYFPIFFFFNSSFFTLKRARELLLSSMFYWGYCFVIILFFLYSLFHFPYPLTLASPRRSGWGLWGLRGKVRDCYLVTYLIQLLCLRQLPSCL